jgi:ATPase subunit of ABC transporter with duplicated ATPase domains
VIPTACFDVVISVLYLTTVAHAQSVNLEVALQECYERMDAIGANTAEFRARKILTGLGFTNNMMENATGSLSGGEFVVLWR